MRTAGTVAGGAALTCWAQLIPFDVTLEPRIVDIYLAEINANAPRRPLRRGDEVSFVVLRDGQPLPGLAVQLRSELSALGIWRQTGAEGRLTVRLRLAGHWILRGTDLRPSPTRADKWESRFLTLAFEVRD